MENKNNTGKENSGNYNSGNYNSGDYNSGYYNSGYYNSGARNSGGYNSGNYNSGARKSGKVKSGNYNSGNYNSGDYNSGDYNSGAFNTDKPNTRLFNKFTDKKMGEIEIPYIDLKITEWLSEDKMTDEQKKNDPDFHIRGGQLVKRDYKEAWKLAWSEIDQATKNKFVTLPNFDAEIFFEITGVDLREKNNSDCGMENPEKIIVLNGEKYKLVE